jgi:hypothetical protein
MVLGREAERRLRVVDGHGPGFFEKSSGEDEDVGGRAEGNSGIGTRPANIAQDAFRRQETPM